MTALGRRKRRRLVQLVMSAKLMASLASPSAADPARPSRAAPSSGAPLRAPDESKPTGGLPRPHAATLSPSPKSSPSAPAIRVRPGLGEDPLEPREPVEGPLVRPNELFSPWYERRVEVFLVPARPGVTLTIRPLGAPAETALCDDKGCVASLRPGQYEIAVLDEGAYTGSRELTLSHTERLLLIPPDRGARTTGLMLGIGGSVLFAAGLAMSLIAYSSPLTQCRDGYCHDTPPWFGPLGITAAVTGAITMPLGWVLFGNNLKPRIERTPLEPDGWRKTP